MTNDTSYRAKGRAVFLAAIMVLSVLAMSTALVGTTAASHEPSPTSVAVTDLNGQSYWQGETLNISGFNTDETVEFEEVDGDGFTQETADSNGNVEIDTSALGTGDWDVTGVSSGANGTFTIRIQNYQTVAFDPNPADRDTTLTIDTNRAEYNQTVSVDSVSMDELQAAFADSDYTVHDNTFVLTSNDGDYTIDTTELPNQEHEFTFEVVDTTASATANLTVQEPEAELANFGADSHNEHVGDEVEFEVSTSGSPDEVWINMMEDGENFEATFNATVTDNSEPLTVTWNTHHGLDSAENYGLSVENGNIQSISASGPAISGADHWPNEGWTFNLESYTSEADADSGDFDDVAVINLEERSTDELNTWTAPGVQGHSIDDDIEDILEDATQRTTVANQDLLIAEVQASGLYGYLNETPSGFATEGLNFSVEGEEGRFESAPGSEISELGSNAASITAQPEDDVFYVVIDSSQIANISDGDTWDAEFSIEGANNPYVENANDDAMEPDEVVNDAFTWENREIELTGTYDENDRLQLPANENAEVTAETNVAPNTNVNLRLNLPQDFRTASGEVAEDGTFSAAVDLSGLEQGTQLSRVRVRAPNSNTQHEVEGVIGEGAEASFGISADAPSTVNVDDSASLDVTVTNDGGASGTAEITVEVDGETVADTTADLGSGEEWSESYDIDTSEAGDVSWSVETQHDSASGTVTVEEDTDDEGEEPPTDEGGEEPPEEDGDEGQPGFGLVVALFALIGAALLAVRRQN